MFEWIPIELRMPHMYDLVQVLYKDETTQFVWHTGQGWDGGRPISKEEVIAWRKPNAKES